MGWLAKLRAKQNKTEAESAAQRAGGRWENEGGALAPDEDAPDREAADEEAGLEDEQVNPPTTN